MPEVLLIDPCNFVDYPVGGQLSFAKQLMKAFGNRLALVGVSTDGAPVGSWVARTFGGIKHMCYGFCRCRPTAGRPIIPGRMSVFLGLLKHRKAIYSLGVHNVFTQSPEVMMAIGHLGWQSICYCFAGAESPLHRPRYLLGRLVAPLFERIWARALAHADVLLASADRRAIDAFVTKRVRTLRHRTIIPFPTRYDDSIFYPMAKCHVRKHLGIPSDGLVIVCVGRVNRVKGWDLLVRAFCIFSDRHPNARIYFVGDGEDRQALLEEVCRLGKAGSVTVTGFVQPQTVAQYLNAADLVVVGSRHEGWSVAMLEALACGRPIVSTDVSGAGDLIKEGCNGYIVRQRDAAVYANTMERALRMSCASMVSCHIAQQYRLANLAEDLGRIWPPLS